MLHIIANETAGSGAGAKVLKRVTQILDEKGLSYRVSPTSGPGDASRLASLAVENGDTDLICLGGDGTIFEVVNGLQGRFARLYFVPCGTGNDFVKVLDLPKDPVEALAKQLEGTPHRIDVGRVNDHYFLNESGGGFDVEVLKETLRFKKLGKGLVPYLFGLLTSLKSFRPLSVEIPKGRLTAITGVSGSGKTTLILESLVPALDSLCSGRKMPGHIRSIDAEGIRHIKLIDATPIGINVRSTVATYANVHDELRKFYARTKAARQSGYKAGDFSYNTGSLRCPVCDGTGQISLDVQFLPDVGRSDPSPS